MQFSNYRFQLLLLVMLAIMALIILTIYLTQHQTLHKSAVPDSILETLAPQKRYLMETYYQGVISYHFNTEGHLTSTLQTPEAKKWVDSEFLDITTPTMKANQQGWTITSQQGSINLETQILHLIGEVRMEHAQQNIQLNTPLLSFNHRTKKAYAQQGVELKTPESHTRAKRMEIDIDQLRIQLRGQVVSHIDPIL